MLGRRKNTWKICTRQNCMKFLDGSRSPDTPPQSCSTSKTCTKYWSESAAMRWTKWWVILGVWKLHKVYHGCQSSRRWKSLTRKNTVKIIPAWFLRDMSSRIYCPSSTRMTWKLTAGLQQFSAWCNLRIVVRWNWWWWAGVMSNGWWALREWWMSDDLWFDCTCLETFFRV